MEQKPFKPTLYMPLFVQQPEAIQSALFAIARDVEPRTEPPCEHPKTEPQRRLDGGDDAICVACRAVVFENEPSRESWTPCATCGHDLYIHSLPGYGGCLYGEGCTCGRFRFRSR